MLTCAFTSGVPILVCVVHSHQVLQEALGLALDWQWNDYLVSECEG